MQKVPKKFDIFPAPIHKTSLVLPQIFVVGEVGGSKTKKGYKYRLPETCQGRGPKVRNYRNYNWSHFFSLRFVFSVFYTGIFKSHMKKIPPSKVSIPTFSSPLLFQITGEGLNKRCCVRKIIISINEGFQIPSKNPCSQF